MIGRRALAGLISAGLILPPSTLAQGQTPPGGQPVTYHHSVRKSECAP